MNNDAITPITLDTELLNELLTYDPGTIANMIQSAAELDEEGSLLERLRAGIAEHTNEYDDNGDLINA